MATFPRLFEPLPLRGRVVKNRIVSTAHIPRYGEGGLLNEQHIRYLERKAAGGVGLLINFGSAGIHEEAAAPVETINLWNRANEHPLRDLATRVHAHGCVIMSQATHMGRRAHSLRGGVVTAPSAVPELVHAETPKALTTDEIRAIVASFASAATRLEAYGWDGIEITSFGGHLIEQFWSPVANRRRDAYGGDLEGRMRFSIDVVESVAGAVSEDFLVGFRISGDPGTDVLGLGPDDMLEIASRLDAIGRIDLFDVSGGTGVDRVVQVGTVPVDSFPPGCYNHLGRAMRERLSAPVLLAGRIIGPAEAEAALAEGAADLVGMARALIADPDLPRRAEAGEADRIRPCIAINDECIGRASLGYAMRCAINPEIGRELEPIAYTPTETPRRVVVAGGGPAGMEAARVAAERGHSVVLLERLDRLGGQVVTAARAPGRPHLGRHVAWLERELARLGVDVRTGVSADAAVVRELAPDAIVVATGAEAAVPDESSAAGVPSATEVDVLEGRADVPYGATVLVYDRGGTMRGASAALALAANGEVRVTLVTPLLDPCEKVDPWQRADLLRRLFLAGVDCVQNEILAGGGGRVVLRHSWSGDERPLADYDLVVFAGYSAPRAAFADELADGGAIHLVGDCLAPRRLHDAVVEGVRAGAAV